MAALELMGLPGRPFGPPRRATECQVATGGSCSAPGCLAHVKGRGQRAVWAVQGEVLGWCMGGAGDGSAGM